MKKQIIHIDNAEISLLPQGQEDYISLTDWPIARCKSISYSVG